MSVDNTIVRKQVFEKTAELLQSNRFIADNTVNIEMSTILNIWLDSLDITELVMELEDFFQVKIDQETIDGFKTVEDVVSTVVNLLIEKG